VIVPLLLSALLAGTAAQPPAPSDFHEIAPGILEYHGVRFDQKNHRVSFPAIVNQHQGLIEYLLVNEMGKVHESLLSTTIKPHDIHLALLLIGLKEELPAANPQATVPPMAIDSSYLHAEPKLKGPPVQLTIDWMQNGVRKEVPAEDWVFNLQTRRAMAMGPWTYNGSLVQDGVFLADQEFSIVSVITDPTALVNNSRPGYDNDEIWQVREEAVPPENTPVEVTITLMESTQSRP